MKVRTALTGLLALAAVTIASFAQAGTLTGIDTVNSDVNIPIVLPPDTSSSDFLQPFVQWLTTNPLGGGDSYSVSFTLASNRADGLVSYATGSLSYSPPRIEFVNGRFEITPPTLSGTGSQLFSDRTYTWPSSNGGIVLGPDYPFNPFEADNLGVSIDTANGNVTLTLKSWGNAQITFPTMANPSAGVIYGVGGGTPSMEVLSLQKHYYVIPK